ncbi:MAG TPA: hypothetical protein VKP60_19140, partial [Magnetospirillaceae bacterium]|nr:hypothetical protein [Magnetospirillaceae bacterium]
MTADKLSLLDMLKRSDGLLFIAANAAELAGVLKRVRDELGMEPPEDYMALLRQTDGVVADGVMIYGSKSRDFDDVSLPELVEINLARRDDREDLGGILLIGERDDDLLGYRPSDRLYWRIDRV